MARNLTDFLVHLKAGGFHNVSGARRSASRSGGWSDKDREVGHAAVNDYYGSQPDAVATPKKKRLGVKKKVAKVAAPKQHKGRKKKVSQRRVNRAPAKVSNPGSNPLAAIHLAGEVVGTVAQAVKAMELVKKQSAGKVDVSQGLREAQELLEGAMSYINREVIKSITPVGVSADVIESSLISTLTDATNAVAP